MKENEPWRLNHRDLGLLICREVAPYLFLEMK